VPFVNWRYILFSHNDSDEEMELARKTAAEIGVDRLSWEITDHPENMFSRRFVPGTPEFDRIQYEIWDQDRPRQRHSRRDAARAHRARRHVVARSHRERGAQGRRRASVEIRTRVTNLSIRRSRRRRATAGAWSAWAPSSAPRTARSSTGTTSAPGCPHTCRRGRRWKSPSRSRPRHTRALPAEVRLGQ
jgi:hypothetical protein